MEGGLGKPKELQREDEDAEQIALNQRLEGEKEQYEQIISTYPPMLFSVRRVNS
jgi:hypothetical protein